MDFFKFCVIYIACLETVRNLLRKLSWNVQWYVELHFLYLKSSGFCINANDGIWRCLMSLSPDWMKGQKFGTVPERTGGTASFLIALERVLSNYFGSVFF